MGGGSRTADLHPESAAARSRRGSVRIKMRSVISPLRESKMISGPRFDCSFTCRNLERRQGNSEMNARKCGFAMCAVSIAAEFAWAQAGEGSSRYLTNQPGFWLPQQYRGEHGGGADPARERAARGAVRWWGPIRRITTARCRAVAHFDQRHEVRGVPRRKAGFHFQEHVCRGVRGARSDVAGTELAESGGFVG